MFGIPERHLARYYEILSVLVRHGLGYLIIPGTINTIKQKDLALVGVRLRAAFGELGAAFIKIGQMASTRSDLLPRPIIQELEKLQDRVNPLPFVIVRRIVEDSLKTNIESVYQKFNPIPVASASIAQVHQAELRGGEKVAVKVQRPFLRETVKTDLEIFQVLVGRIEQNTLWGKRYPIRMIFEEFSQSIKKELDFLNEGRNAEKVFKSNKRNSHLVIPKIYWELTNSNVLTMEFISGIPLHEISRLEDYSYNGHKIANRLSKAFLNQLLQGGCFHADPHPGNILILPGDNVALIDFGITGNLTRSMREHISLLVSGIIRGNDTLVLKTLFQMGIIDASVDRDKLQADISALRNKYLKLNQKEIVIGECIKAFFDIIYRHRIHVLPEFVLVGKTFLTLERTLRDLDPSLNLVETLKPFSSRYFWKHISLLDLWKMIWRTRETDTTVH